MPEDERDQPRSAVVTGGGGVRLDIGRKDLFYMFGADANASVSHSEAHIEQIGFLPFEFSTEADSPLGSEFDGVAGQVGQDLAQAQRIASDPAGKMGG